MFVDDVWASLENMINFKSEHHESAAQGFGNLLPDGNWSGLMGLVNRREVDAGQRLFAVTVERTDAVDFTIPLLRTSLCLVIEKPGRNVFKWNNFLKPFSPQLWEAVLVSLLLLACFLSLLYRVKQRLAPDAAGGAVLDLGQSLQYVYTSFCQQGCSVTPSSASCRVVCLVTKLTATILVAGYSAYIVSHLTVHEPQMPFRSLTTLMADGTYKVGVLTNSFILMYLNGSKTKVLRRIYNELVDTNDLPLSELEGLQRTCTRRKYTYLTLCSSVPSEVRYLSCQIAIPWKSKSKRELAIPIAKGSPYRGVLNYYLNRMRNTGLLRRLRDKWWPRRGSDETRPWSSVPMGAVASIMMIPAVGIVAAVVIIVVECIVKRCCSCDKPSNTKARRK
ncbi:glutamate receptor ionotropic, kainate glr-3-like [Periplaneta americana]|uniref:glutamate receptor ionotropic, kainate glr-3-like n=1 Tax=Periplaneta americana TaxID=6978 RepID=UPI0037E77CF1